MGLHVRAKTVYKDLQVHLEGPVRVPRQLSKNEAPEAARTRKSLIFNHEELAIIESKASRAGYCEAITDILRSAELNPKAALGRAQRVGV